MTYSEFPDCCKNCQNLGDDWSEYTMVSVYYCELNIWLPTKKKTCKKQKSYNKALLCSEYDYVACFGDIR